MAIHADGPWKLRARLTQIFLAVRFLDLAEAIFRQERTAVGHQVDLCKVRVSAIWNERDLFMEYRQQVRQHLVFLVSFVVDRNLPSHAASVRALASNTPKRVGVP